jgi:hypothetical protein
MHQIHAILLVINSSRGHQLVFRYPPAPSHDGLVAGKARRPSLSPVQLASTSMHDLRTNSNDFAIAETHHHSNNDSVQKEEPATVTEPLSYLGFDIQFLSNLLAPKASLCNQPFLLTVDELTFIGHPVTVSPTGTAVDSGVGTTDLSHREVAIMSSLLDLTDDIVLRSMEFGGPVEQHSTVMDNAFGGAIDGMVGRSAAPNSPVQHLSMSMFHPVLVVSQDIRQPGFSSYIEYLYHQIMWKLSMLLQLENAYVREEVENLMNISQAMEGEFELRFFLLLQSLNVITRGS